MPRTTTQSSTLSSVVSWPRSRSSSSSSSSTSWPVATASRRSSQANNYSSADFCRSNIKDTPSSYIADEDLLAESTTISTNVSSKVEDVIAPAYHNSPDAYRARKMAQEQRRREAMMTSTRKRSKTMEKRKE